MTVASAIGPANALVIAQTKPVAACHSGADSSFESSFSLMLKCATSPAIEAECRSPLSTRS